MPQNGLPVFPRVFISRVLIIDFDIHHGNGTQSLFEENEMVMYISVHRFDHGAFYPNNPEANYDNVGFGIGEGRTMNIPFNDVNIFFAD